MAKINRFDGNVQAFASQAQGTERTIFGGTTQDDTLDANLNADFLRGWGIVGVNENPTKQDFNGLAYTLGQLIAYLHQMGVPEWNASQEYFDGAVVLTGQGLYKLVPGGDGSVDPDADDGTNWGGNLAKAASISMGDGTSVEEAVANRVVRASLTANPTFTVLIPTDYPTMQAAVDDLSERYGTGNGRTIELLIEAGHQLTAGLLVQNGDYSHFKVTAEDATVTLDAAFVGIDVPTIPGLGNLDEDCLIVGINARMPVLSCLIDMEGNYGDGYYGVYNCIGSIDPDCGVVNAGGNGLHMRASMITAPDCIFTGSAGDGFRAQQSSTGTVQGGDFSGGGNYGLNIRRASAINAASIVANNCNLAGLNVLRSWCFAAGATCSNNTGDGFLCSTLSNLILQRSGSTTTAEDNGGDDIAVNRGGIVYAADVITTNGTPALEDCSVDSFNTPSKDGCIYFDGGNVGVHGIGIVGDPQTIVDLDDDTEIANLPSGKYRVDAGTLNRPIAESGTVEISRFASSTATIEFHTTANNRLFKRALFAGTLSGWKEVDMTAV